MAVWAMSHITVNFCDGITGDIWKGSRHFVTAALLTGTGKDVVSGLPQLICQVSRGDPYVTIEHANRIRLDEIG